MGRTIEVQIQRILEKLNQVRRKGLTCFGAESHKFRLNPPIAESVLNGFEAKHRIRLPQHYRSFLGLAGNGGAVVEGVWRFARRVASPAAQL